MTTPVHHSHAAGRPANALTRAAGTVRPGAAKTAAERNQQAQADRDAAAPYAAKSRKAYLELKYSSLGIELALSVILGLLFGRWLDGKVGTEPLFMIVFLLLGCVSGVRALLRVWKVAPEAGAEASASAEAAAEPTTTATTDESKGREP